MQLTALDSVRLKKILVLLEHKDALERKIAKINGILDQFEISSPAPIANSKRYYRKKAPRHVRVPLKDAILKVLAEAGPTGLRVQEIAREAKANLGSVTVWIYTTGKKTRGLKKIAPGTYTYRR